MTTLAIMATYEKKRLKCYGTVAAGEHVAVTITDGAQWIGEGKALRLRVLFGPNTVAVFPFAEGDAWTATGTGSADATCELNLNTLQAAKYLKCGGPCLWILDDVENHTLYATGEFDVLPWPKRRGIDEPIDLDGYPLLLDEIKDLKEAFEEYQRTVAQMLAAKQDTIFDLAAIRSGAAAGATAVQPSQIARFVDDAEYKAQYGEQNKPAILFKHGTNVIVALDATPFVRDGMVSDVEIVGGNLVITFNTDSGKQPIEIPLTDIFDPDNYYDRTAADGKFVAKEAGKGLSTEDYTTAEKTKLGGIAAGAQANVIETVKVNGTALTPQDKAVDIPVPTLDNTVTPTSANGVKSSGIWSAIWGALASLPTGFSSLYDWVVDQLAGKVSKTGDTMTGGLTVPNFTVGSRKSGSIVGTNSTAEGRNTSAGNDCSHAEGYNTTASGYYSHAEGNGTTTKSEGEHAQGRYNASHKASVTIGDAGNTLSSIGFGTANDKRKNAVETMQDGKTYIYELGGYDGTNPTNATDLASAVNAKANRASPATAGNLAALDANGNPTDSLIPAANVATKGSIPYSLGTPITIDTASSETVEGETVNYGVATLVNRTANVVQVTAATALDELRITFPAATSGKVRDFGLCVEIGTGSAALAAPALVPVAPTGETITMMNADGEMPTLADGTTTASGFTVLYFTEIGNGTFLVKGEQVEEVA